ncbi:hypothetical protein ACFLUZ_02325 [Chloroflexota bacterium]
MRKALLALFIVWLVIIPGCKLLGSSDDETYRLGLITEIKAFENRLGFSETENFKTYSDEIEAYDYYFYTSKTELPYSLDDPLLQNAAGKPGDISVDSGEYDVFYYSIEAIAGVKTPVTKSLLQAPLPRFIHVILHEDWHEQMDSPLGIEEPCAEIVSYQAALLFTEEKFGEDSAVCLTLKKDFSNRLKESELYRQYYEELSLLYSSFDSGLISQSETLSRKAKLLESMAKALKNIWGASPRQLNNAFIAFQMTYLRHLPLMYQVYSAQNFDLMETMAIFHSVPGQGAKFDDVEELKNIEREVADYLQEPVPLAK